MEGLTSRDLFLLVAGAVVAIVIERVLLDRVIGRLWLRTLALGKRGRLADLRWYRDWLERMHNGSDRDYYSWLLSTVLGVLMLLTMVLVFNTWTRVAPALGHAPQPFLYTVLELLFGAMAVVVAGRGLRDCRHLRQYEDTINRLDQKIARLENKLSERHTGEIARPGAR